MNAEPRDVVGRWYAALAGMDIAAYAATLHDDVVINVAGRTPVSGRWHGKRVLLEQVLPMVMANLDATTINLARRWRIMAVDGPIVVGMMQGSATTLDGETYDQSYCQVFRVEHGVIVESWEFRHHPGRGTPVWKGGGCWASVRRSACVLMRQMKQAVLFSKEKTFVPAHINAKSTVPSGAGAAVLACCEARARRSLSPCRPSLAK